MITVVTWKWQPPEGYRSTFGPETVNTLRDMVRRNYPKSFRMICVTDDSRGIDADIEIVADDKDFCDVPSPHGGKNPSCYRRLRMFKPDIAKVFGPRFVSMDLDCVITGDLTPLFDRTEPIILWGDTNPRPGSHYNGSFTLMTAGARPQVWTSFDPLTSPRKSMQAGCWGSDQGFISHCLGAGEAKWSKVDGVYSFRNDLQRTRTLPSNAKVCFFHGRWDPWLDCVKSQHPWVAQHYRRDTVNSARVPQEACL